MEQNEGERKGTKRRQGTKVQHVRTKGNEKEDRGKKGRKETKKKESNRVQKESERND